MKKLIFVLIIFFACVNLLMSQDGGDGSIGNPYYGNISGNVAWDPAYGSLVNDIPTIYASDLTIRSGATLTISEAGGGGILSFSDGTLLHSLTIESGGTLVIQQSTGITVNNITNDGTLILESTDYEWGSASMILNGYSGNGTTQLELYLLGGQIEVGSWQWHYISVPISNLDLPTFNTSNIFQYVEVLVVGDDNMAGWVDYDGIQYSSGTNVGYGFTTLTLGRGYNFYSGESPVLTLTANNVPGGPRLNYTDKSCAVTSSSGSAIAKGWNLIGNPFTSYIDWNFIVSDNFPGNIDNAIYFTMNDEVQSYVPPLGTGSATGYIPPMQGFFVHANGASSVPLKQIARTHYTIGQTRYKGISDYAKSSDTVSFVRLKFENQKDNNDLIVRFNKKATASFDKMFDAYEFSKTSGAISAWTKTGNIDYSINGLPFPETTVEIPVGINVKTAGIYKLSSSELNKLDNYSVTLKDKLTNITVDIKRGEFLEFNSPEGMIEDRFVLKVTNLTTGISDVTLTDKKFSIYSSAGTINILSLTDEFSNYPAAVNIYDLTGRIVLKQNNIEWHGKGDLKQISLNSAAMGLYIVEIKAGNKKYVGKVNLR